MARFWWKRQNDKLDKDGVLQTEANSMNFMKLQYAHHTCTPVIDLEPGRVFYVVGMDLTIYHGQAFGVFELVEEDVETGERRFILTEVSNEHPEGRTREELYHELAQEFGAG